MNTQNTQEWKVIPDFAWQGRHPYHDARYVATSNDVEIFDSPDPNDNPPRTWRFAEDDGVIICTLPDSPNQKAHAALIAAAPELLCACKVALVSLKGTQNPIAIKALENAITKAEGKPL